MEQISSALWKGQVDSRKRLENRGPGCCRALRAVLTRMQDAERIQDKGSGGRRLLGGIHWALGPVEPDKGYVTSVPRVKPSTHGTIV